MVDGVQPAKPGTGQFKDMEAICQARQDASAINSNLFVVRDRGLPYRRQLAEGPPGLTDPV
eukprot:1410144-Alexandrium_andersonii.AAC.1